MSSRRAWEAAAETSLASREAAGTPPAFVEAAGAGRDGRNGSSVWTFLTNHSHVLICLARNPQLRLRDVAVAVGITERAVQRIVAELEGAGMITRARDGRRNHYEINRSLPLRHPVEAGCTIGNLLDMVSAPSSDIDRNED